MHLRHSLKLALQNSPLSVLSILLLLTLSVPFTTPAKAVGLIRDAETEELIRDYSRPILRAAGLSSQNIAIHIIGSKTFNAFVVDGRNMFIHMGAIMQAQTPNQIIGVLAHEAGHIAGGTYHVCGPMLQKPRRLTLC